MRQCFLCNSRGRDKRVQEAQEHVQKGEYTLTYHRFPKNINTRMLWIEACNLNANSDDVSTLVICSKHFAVDDYVDLNAKQFGGTIRLKSGAVPRTKFNTNKQPSLHNGIFKQEMISECTDETLTATHLPGTSSKLPNKDPNMCPVVSETNAESKYIPGPLNLPAKNSEDAPSSPKKRKFVLPRHCASLTEEDFRTPRSAKRNLQLLKNCIAMQRRKLESVQRQNRRLKTKITSVKVLLSQLHSGDLNDEDDAEQSLNVNPGHHSENSKNR